MSESPLTTRFCIYTILHSETLHAALRKGGGVATERQVWVSGEKLFREAQKDGMRMPIIFAAAEDGPKGLLYHALLDAVETDAVTQTTTYRYSGLKEIPNRPPLSSLKKRSDNQPLSDDFIRPYSICYTPSFVKE